MDGDVNTPVIFDCDPTNETQKCEHTIRTQAQVAYQSIWVYYNPQHGSDESLYKRMTEFSVECMGSNQQWTRVLDPDTQHAQQQFEAATEKWNQFTFDTACTSQTWKIGDFAHGTHKKGHTYVFEVKYSESVDTPSVCTPEEMRSYDAEIVTCLPPPLPARVQGWCTGHYIAKSAEIVQSASRPSNPFKNDIILPNVVVSSTFTAQTSQEKVLGESEGTLKHREDPATLGAAQSDSSENTCSCPNGVAAAGTLCTSDGGEVCTSCSDGFLLSGGLCQDCAATFNSSSVFEIGDTQTVTDQFNTKLACGATVSPPCGSQLTMEFSFDWVGYKHTGWPGGGSLPVKARVQDKDGQSVSTADIQLATWYELTPSEGYRRRRLALDQIQKKGCKNSWCYKKHVRGKILPSAMAKLRKEPYVMLASSTEFVSPNGGKGYWKIKGDARVTYWWKPPSPEMECQVPDGGLQAVTEP